MHHQKPDTNMEHKDPSCWDIWFIPTALAVFVVFCLLLKYFGLIPHSKKVSNLPDLPYANEVMAASEAHGVDPALILAVIETESTFNPNAKSHTGAKGLIQLTSGTAKYVGVRNAHDPKDNIMGGTKYLRELLDTFGGNVARAAAGYNAGPGKAKHMKSPHNFGYSKKVLTKYARYAMMFKGGTK